MRERPPLGTPAARSPFVAAFLSLLFPGLGQLYAGDRRRALLWAAAPLVLIAVGLIVAVLLGRFGLVGLAVEPWFLGGLFAANLVVLAYRVVAIIDAWLLPRRPRAAWATTAAAQRRASGGPAGGAIQMLSTAGLLAIILVASGVHVAVARYDLLAGDLIRCVFDPTSSSSCGSAGGPGDSGQPGAADTTGPGVSLPPVGTALPAASLPAWNGTSRLNILLVGVDQRPAQQVFNTDTLIVVSIDPATARVAMFSIPRDTVGVPLPPGPLQRLGSTYPDKVNSIWATLRGRSDLCPGSNDTARGFNCLKSVIGYLFGLDVQYYAEVNFGGFTKIVDGLGGVTVDVQAPVTDNRYPGNNGGDLRVYIPAGLQHMDGTEALIYARSRHGSNDFDRGARQQRVLTSLLAQADFGAIVANLDQLVSDFEETVHTDIPASILPQLVGLASRVDTKSIQSYVFAPPLYETESYIPGVQDYLYPKVNVIRAAVRSAFTVDPNLEAQREQVAQEAATVWVLNGTGQANLASDVAAYLDYQGFAATAPLQRAPTTASVQVLVYNGAESRLPVSVARLQAIFGVTATPKQDPSVKVDIVVIVGRSTPDLTPPPNS